MHRPPEEYILLIAATDVAIALVEEIIQSGRLFHIQNDKG